MGDLVKPLGATGHDRDDQDLDRQGGEDGPDSLEGHVGQASEAAPGERDREQGEYQEGGEQHP